MGKKSGSDAGEGGVGFGSIVGEKEAWKLTRVDVGWLEWAYC